VGHTVTDEHGAADFRVLSQKMVLLALPEARFCPNCDIFSQRVMEIRCYSIEAPLTGIRMASPLRTLLFDLGCLAEESD
jgi:hypothetical protein